jgi:hypothetical protein
MRTSGRRHTSIATVAARGLPATPTDQPVPLAATMALRDDLAAPA